MYVRLSRFAGLDSERVSETVEQFKNDAIPLLQQQSGFRGVTIGVNQKSGQALAITLWDTEGDMTASEKVASDVRARAIATAAPSRDPAVDHYEVVVHE